LKAEIREQIGTKSSQKVRKAGRIPAIVYGHKKEPQAISLDKHNLVESIHHGQRLLDVQIGSKTDKMLIKDIQYDYLGRDIIHVDLIRVDVTETIRVSVPVELKGAAKGTEQGGIVNQHMNHVEVECTAANIPETIVVSVKELGVGDNIHAGDISMPTGARLVSDPDILIASCSVVTEAKTTEELEEEQPSAPEVIGEKKEEAEEEQQ
jgi:large subunit ribosomal protein L25